ncbi:cell division protein FtsQ/DivIB [Malonomonas rubra]|uniref:cell division protein FtsQ/DivIB n=1 Tax=Malonomonas rubra TaxID=57040 RepID=UPI0026E9E351|nr:FtsQ-type POTRA domain-containing protein [Malonomonas rubra]
MRDLKKQQKTKRKVRQNRKKTEKKPLNLRKFLHRALRIGVASFSGALIVVGGFLLVQLLLASDLFRIEQICVQGGRHLSVEQVVAQSDIKPGVNTFSLDLDLIGRKVAENPWVSEAKVQRIFPKQIEIQIEERVPVAIINLGYLYYLGNRGEVFKVLEADDSLDFPVVTGFDYQKIEQRNQQSAEDLQQVVALLLELQQREKFGLQQISEVHREKSGGFALFTLEGGVKVRLGREAFGNKLDRLERIYAELQPRLPILDYIDLNVDEKVIVRIERPKQAAKS